MASLDSAPNFGLLTEADLRDLSGVNLYRRGSQSVSITMPNTVYLDLVEFLNGYSANQTIADTVEYYATVAGSASAGSWSVYIGADDKVSLLANMAFTVTHSSGTDWMGIGGGTVSSSPSGADHIATLPEEWTRGRVAGPSVFSIDPTGEPAFDVTIGGEYQDLRVAMREAGSVGDVDDSRATLSLSYIDTTTFSLSGINSVRWLIDEDGFAVCSYPQAMTDITWQSDTLRKLLGFTGDETPTSAIGSSYERIKGTYPAAMVLVPTRPVERHQLTSDTVATRRRLIGGGQVSNKLATYTRSRVDFYLDAAADERDLYQHFVDRFAPYTGPGRRLTYYGEWGDSRRHGYVLEDAYGTLYSLQEERGRYVGTLMEGSFDLNYPGRIRRRVPLSVTVEHDEVR
jgi:hypothetical protein